MLNLQQIRNLLLDTNIIIENNWFDNYCKLIYENLTTPKLKFKTQSHHTIPISYYKEKFNCKTRKEAEQIAKQYKNIEVNLYFADHVLCHFYLANCVESSTLQHKLLCAVRRVLRTYKLKDLESYEQFLIDQRELLQLNYEQSKHINCLKSDTPQKISLALLGRVSICKDNHFKYVYPTELSNYLAEGWVVEHNKQTDRSKKAISEKNSNRKHISKGNSVKVVKIEELEEYLQNGWVLGDITRRNQTSPTKGRIALNKDKEIIYVTQDELQAYLDIGWIRGTGLTHVGSNKGKKLSAEQREKLAAANGIRGKHAMHKGDQVIYVAPNSVEDYLAHGYLLGTGKSSKTVLNKKWINNGKQEIYSDIEELDKYLNNGWKLGRLRRKEL